MLTQERRATMSAMWLARWRSWQGSGVVQRRPRFLRQPDKWQLRPIRASISLERKESHVEEIAPQSFCGI